MQSKGSAQRTPSDKVSYLRSKTNQFTLHSQNRFAFSTPERFAVGCSPLSNASSRACRRPCAAVGFLLPPPKVSLTSESPCSGPGLYELPRPPEAHGPSLHTPAQK